MSFFSLLLAAAVATAGNNPSASPTLKPFDEADLQTRELLVKMLDGFGGEKAVTKLRLTRRVATVAQRTAPGTTPERLALEAISEYPDHHLVRVRAANGLMTLGISGSKSYLIPPPEKQTVKGAAIKLTPEERTDLVHYFSADPLYVVKMMRTSGISFAAGPEVMVGDRACRVLHSNVDGLEIDWTIDLESGRPIRTVTGGQVSEFDDWRPVGTVSVPFRIRTTKDGAPFAETTLSAFEIEPQINTLAVFREPDLWFTRWKVPETRVWGGYQTVYVFLRFLD